MYTGTENAAVDRAPEVVVKKPASRFLSPVLIVGLVIGLGGLFAVGVLPKLSHAKQLKSAAPSSSALIVETAQPGAATVQIMLPASVEAVRDTPIYARTNGYLRSFTVDIGAHVEAGQILAEIETPEIDEQLRQAQASLAQAEANLSLTQTTFERWKRLLQSKVVAAQEYDERRVQLETVKADVAAAQANVQRLTRMQEFQKIIAPYAGTIIIRNTDIGALISGDNSSARMLFRIAQTSTLRVFVNVPQSHYRLINEGVPAELTFREFPGRAFMGKVVRTAGALDPDTRTLRTEVQVPNEQGELIPGLYAEVKFNLLQEHPAVVVASRAVIIEANGPQIAAVDSNGRVTLRPVVLGRDFGKTVEIATGLEPGTRFVANPTDTLSDGTLVKVNAPEPIKIATN